MNDFSRKPPKEGHVCACSACQPSEYAQHSNTFPYRYVPSVGQGIFHLVLWFSLPLIGALLIGASWQAVIPVVSFVMAYLLTSFTFCARCAYHHAGVTLCGCFPKSIFPFKRHNRPWGNRLNLLGWPGLVLLGVGPTVAVLANREDWIFVMLYLLVVGFILLLTSTFSCPNCRQRDVCYLGIFTALIRKKQGYGRISQQHMDLTTSNY